MELGGMVLTEKLPAEPAAAGDTVEISSPEDDCRRETANSTADLRAAVMEMASDCVADREPATSWIWWSNRCSAPCSRKKVIRKSRIRRWRAFCATWEWTRSWRTFRLSAGRN